MKNSTEVLKELEALGVDSIKAIGVASFIIDLQQEAYMEAANKAIYALSEEFCTVMDGASFMLIIALLLQVW